VTAIARLGRAGAAGRGTRLPAAIRRDRLDTLGAGNPATTGTGLRVAVVGDEHGALAGGITTLPVDEGLQPAGKHGPRHLDALLIGSPTTRTAHGSPAVDELVTEARAAGVPVVDHVRTTGGSQASHVAAGDTTPVGPGASGGPWPRAIVDTTRVTPIRVRWQVKRPPVVLGLERGPGWDAGMAGIRVAVGDTALRVAVPERPDTREDEQPDDADGWSLPADPALRPLPVPTEPAELVAALRRHVGVIDHAALHPDPASRAAWLATLACAGVPLVVVDGEEGHLDPELTRRLGPRLTAELRRARVDDLFEASRRDRCSVRQRREALREHGAERVWRSIASELDLLTLPEPGVSVLLASNRPHRVLAAAARVAAFGYPHRELIVAAHGDGFPDDLRARVARLLEGTGTHLEVVRVPAHRRLGEVLTLATAAASGELVTKLDDDDRYDVEHLDDLVTALRYSGATVAAKGSEFVHLGEIDVTIRRLPKGAESGSRTVAGGTLLLGRDDLNAVGGWQQAPRSVDQLLLDDVEAAGGRLHRTHGHGFVLDRHGTGHTWRTPTDYFLRQAVAQWPGLDLDAAGFTAPDAGASVSGPAEQAPAGADGAAAPRR
jgi:hypothetical protein